MIRLFCFALISLFLLSGCGVHGRKMDPAIVCQIQKGDTRTEVESKLGEPDFEDLPENGICKVAYRYDESINDIPSLIPYVNLFAGGPKVRSQYFTIVYNEDIVQECKFTDNTMTISGGFFNMHMRQKPTPGAHPPNSSSTKPK